MSATATIEKLRAKDEYYSNVEEQMIQMIKVVVSFHRIQWGTVQTP